MRKPGGRSDHPVAIWAQGGQPLRHLARQALNAADLAADRRAGVDPNLGSGLAGAGATIDRCIRSHRPLRPLGPSGADSGTAVWAATDYCSRSARLSASPDPSSPTPIATASHVSKPVRGSVAADPGSAAEVVDAEFGALVLVLVLVLVPAADPVDDEVEEDWDEVDGDEVVVGDDPVDGEEVVVGDVDVCVACEPELEWLEPPPSGSMYC